MDIHRRKQTCQTTQHKTHRSKWQSVQCKPTHTSTPPTSQQMGMLKRCQVDLGNDFTHSIIDTVNQVISTFITEVNGMLEISKIKSGQSFSYKSKYDSAKCRWYPLGRFNTTELKNVAFANKFMPRQCPTTTGNIEANYATLVNHNFLDETKPLMIKTEG